MNVASLPLPFIVDSPELVVFKLFSLGPTFENETHVGTQRE